MPPTKLRKRSMTSKVETPDLDFSSESAPVPTAMQAKKEEHRPAEAVRQRTEYMLDTVQDGEKVTKDLADFTTDEFVIWARSLGFQLDSSLVDTYEGRVKYFRGIVQFTQIKWPVTHLVDMYS